MADQPGAKPEPWSKWPFRFMLCIVIIGVLVYVLTPSLTDTGWHIKPEMVCLNNLLQIRMVIRTYTAQHKDAFPADVRQYVAKTLKGTRDYEPAAMTCPKAAEANYVFIPENAGGDSNVPIVYEPLSNHKKGANVLFADLHVEFVTKAEYDQVIMRRKTTATRPQ